MKVLLISQVFYPDEVAVANLFTDLCSVLVTSGLEIEVWCAQPSYTCSKRQPNRAFYNGINIHYLTSTNFPKDKILGRVSNFCSFSLSTVIKLFFSAQKSLVISHTTPPFLAIMISLICKIKNRRNIYVLMDIFPDGLVRLKKASLFNPLIYIWQKLHYSALERSSRIIVIGRDMKDWLATKYPDCNDKLEYIPLWQNDELIKPVSFFENKFILDHNLQNYFIVQYSGNMGLWNEMKTIGQAVNRNLKDVFFLFIGGGMRRQELLDSFNNPDPENVLLVPFLPNEDFAFSVSACHVALVSLRKGLEGMAVPSKIIGIMAAGVPVIALAPDQSEIAYIVREENCGIVIDPEDFNGLIGAILKLKDDEKLRTILGLNGRTAFEKKYTTNIIAKRYLDIITEAEKN